MVSRAKKIKDELLSYTIKIMTMSPSFNRRLFYREFWKGSLTPSSVRVTSDTIQPTDANLGLAGLHNLGNTCYMNCVLQCLVHSPEFSESFKTLYRLSKQFRGNADLVKSWCQFLSDYSKSLVPLSPHHLKHHIQCLCPALQGSAQQDASDFLRVFLDHLHQQLNRTKDKPPYRQMPGDVSKGLDNIADIWWEYALERENSYVTDVLQGQLVTITLCKSCKKINVSCDTFLDLSLQIPFEYCSVSDCVYEFEKEISVDTYSCSKCGNSKATQRTVVYRFPKVLVLQLKRFAVCRTRSVKNRSKVQIPHALNIGEGNRRTNYRLHGVVHHLGSLNSGHYVAECAFGQEMYCFDDCDVYLSKFANTTSSAYILFYHRIL